jgi:16S rRNA (guanine527-N7)-methyltransferase
VPGAHDGGPSPILHDVLEDARALGFFGPGPLEPQVAHAQGFATIGRCLSPGAPVCLIDLGAGGGLPGLVVATEWPEVTLTLLEAMGKRASFLRQAVERLSLGHRVSVLEERAEIAGRSDDLRATFDGVLARSFGRPAVLAECAAPFLRVGAWMLVSEPPRAEAPAGEGDRWPPGPLGQLGLEPAALLHEGYEYQVLRQVHPCPERYPRRNGVPAKKPLF